MTILLTAAFVLPLSVPSRGDDNDARWHQVSFWNAINFDKNEKFTMNEKFIPNLPKSDISCDLWFDGKKIDNCDAQSYLPTIVPNPSSVAMAGGHSIVFRARGEEQIETTITLRAEDEANAVPGSPFFRGWCVVVTRTGLRLASKDECMKFFANNPEGAY
jgi:hypothetical protein